MRNYILIFFLLSLAINVKGNKTPLKEDRSMINGFLFSVSSFYDNLFREKKHNKDTTLYDFKAKTIDGKEYNFSNLKGKKVLIVNTASKCGLTPQYSKLQELYETYKDKNFEIIAFPANNFGSQEPGSNKEIKEFCSTKFNISFQLMEKISVKGKDIHPIYRWLTSKNGYGVKWNFQKFMINPEGKLVGMAYPMEKPFSKKILDWIKN